MKIALDYHVWGRKPRFSAQNDRQKPPGLTGIPNKANDHRVSLVYFRSLRKAGEMQSRLRFVVVLLMLVSPIRVWGIILYSTPTRNTEIPGTLTNRAAWSSPPGAGDPRRLLDSGWQFQGQFGIYLGTPIAPNYFITASHIGGNVGDQFHYKNLAGQNVSFNTTSMSNISGTDLRIWEVNGAFDHYAPMWDESVDGSEAGKAMVVIGRGTERGNEVLVGGLLKGWEWGNWDTVQSWGENEVTQVVDIDDLGELLEFEFNRGMGPNEASLSAGDSGGGVFIQSGGIWKLAGINLGVVGPWRTAPNGTSFSASIFDAGGLYIEVGDPGTWEIVPDGLVGASYSSRISGSLDAINLTISGNNAVPIPEPAIGIAPLLVLALIRSRKNSAKTIISLLTPY